MIFKKPPRPTPKATKTDMLAARPQRVAGAEEKSIASGKWRLVTPVQPSRWASLLLRVPRGMTKTFELDELGKFVWDACDGKTNVRQIIRRLAKRYNLNEREAEVSTVAFLKTLTGKGLITLAVRKEV